MRTRPQRAEIELDRLERCRADPDVALVETNVPVDEGVHLVGLSILSGGPIVEGAVLAAVQASIGSSLDEVLEAAESAAALPKG